MRWLFSATLLLLSLAAGHSAEPAKKPNIVFILADDLGYGDLKCYGHPYARTPNLDQLAAEGTRFIQAYMTGVTCCPSRTGLMTGKFPATFKDYPAVHGFGKQTTITELLKKEGYRTGHFGKWHIGPQARSGTYGIDVVNAVDEEPKKKKREDPRGRDAGIFDEAIQYIEKNKGGPFYVNVWGHISHFPVNSPAALVGRFKDLVVQDSDFSAEYHDKLAWVRKNGGEPSECLRRYLADVSSMDESVGRLLQKLDALGLRENTLVVFSSDQGNPEGSIPKKAENLPEAEKKARIEMQMNSMGYAGDHRGGKHGMYEGGVRVPFIVRWPGHVPAKTVNTTSVICGIDWLPTLCALAGAKLDAKDLDGEDVSTVWLGKDRERTKPLFWKTNNVRSDLCIREGKWKLHDPNGKKGEVELYDLVADHRESTNLASKHPEVVKELKTMLEKWNATLPKEYSKAIDNEK